MFSRFYHRRKVDQNKAKMGHVTCVFLSFIWISLYLKDKSLQAFLHARIEWLENAVNISRDLANGTENI